MNLDNPNLRTLERKKEIACDKISEVYDLPIDAVVPEMLDFFLIVAMGAKKYEMNGWLKPDGKKCSERSMHDSMFHHLAESSTGDMPDEESGLDPLLHLACRAMMLYTRRQRGIKYKEPIKAKFDCFGEIDDSNCTTMEQHIEKMNDYGSNYYRQEE